MTCVHRVYCLHKPLPVRLSQSSGSLSHQSRQYRYRRRDSRACRTSHCRAQVQHHMQLGSLFEAMTRLHKTHLWQVSCKGASISEAMICPGWCHKTCCWQDSCKGASISHMHSIWTRFMTTWQHGSVMLQRSRPHPGSMSHLPPLSCSLPHAGQLLVSLTKSLGHEHGLSIAGIWWG